MSGQILIGILTALGLFWQVQASANCTFTGAGRYADPVDTTCKNYTLCIYSSTTDTFTSYDYSCPSTSIFNANTNLCTDPTNYTCNVTSSVCTADGYVADTTSTDCTTYIECVEINGAFTESTLTCPASTFFNPTSTICETDYSCTTTTTPTFTCTAAGRFADSTDTTCQSYFMCVLQTTGTYVQYNYTCPSTSVFNPNSRVCTASYTCGI